jgi:hypothetical protein
MLIIELQCNFISASGTKYSIWTHGNIRLGKRDVPVSGIIWTGPKNARSQIVVTLPCHIKIFFNFIIDTKCMLLAYLNSCIFSTEGRISEAGTFWIAIHGHKHTSNQTQPIKPCLNTKLPEVTIPNTVLEIYTESFLENPVLARQVDRQRCINFSVPGVRTASYRQFVSKSCPTLTDFSKLAILHFNINVLSV